MKQHQDSELDYQEIDYGGAGAATTVSFVCPCSTFKGQGLAHMLGSAIMLHVQHASVCLGPAVVPSRPHDITCAGEC